MVNPVLDLRSNTKIGVANDPSPGIGLFNDGGNLVVGPWLWNAAGVDVAHWGAPVDVSGLGYTNLGSDPYATMSVANRTALAVTLGVNPGLLPNSNLADILAHFILGTLADPTGVNGVKPLRMGKGGLELLMGEFGQVLVEPFNLTHPNFQSTLDVRFADYRRERAYVDTHQEPRRTELLQAMERETGHIMRDFYGRMGDDLLDKVVPLEYLDGVKGTDTWRIPSTSFADNFNRTNENPLGSPWSVVEEQVAGDSWRVTTNQGACSSSAGFSLSRYDTELSSVDHYCECEIHTTSVGRHPGPVCRKDTSATLTYYYAYWQHSNSRWEWAKRVAGTKTILSDSGAESKTAGDVIRLTVATSSQIVAKNGTPFTGTTDTAITTGKNCGLYTNNAPVTVDNWAAADSVVLAHSQIVIIG